MSPEPQGGPNVAEIIDVLRRSGLTPSETLNLPGRDAEILAIPKSLHAAVGERLTAAYAKGLYAHQALAIERSLAREDICLATPTASGKSLVFMSVAAHLTCSDRFAKVLAIYPARALIQDQLSKWHEFLEPFGIRVGFIDGSVAPAERAAILSASRVVLMTPDVAHAWLMSRLGQSDISGFLGRLSLVVLDEAHVYDGAFGTNMAYFLRRLAIASKRYRLICSTATIGEPAGFMRQLTGRDVSLIGPEMDGSSLAEKTLVLAPLGTKGSFDLSLQLLANLAAYGKARFLAFGDSRKAVERLVAAILRQKSQAEEPVEDEEADDAVDEPNEPNQKLEHVLPYRAGYEAADRQAIQDALVSGSLAGVVSTSALELGLDIGDLDVVVLLNTAPSMKAFFQRIGRGGRRRSAVCILLDDQGAMRPLESYVRRKPEPSWLYLENRYIQYANALCTAGELQARGIKSTAGIDFMGLPESFSRLVENELNPTEAVPPDLYSLKQKAQSSPHYEFPIRSAAEPNFDVEGSFGHKLGTLSYAQALREAYPGAVYYYMARPYRAYALDFKKGLIKAKRTRYFTTKPIADNLAFPNFKNGMLTSWRSGDGFICEAELQVSERVRGFVEQRGQKKTSHEYGPTSSYHQKPLTRFFQTTGMCWAFPGRLERSEALATAVVQAFSTTCGVHERDLGVAFFKSNEGPFSPTPVSGTVIFDATNGSLRLTERLGLEFGNVLRYAIEHSEDSKIGQDLIKLRDLVAKVEQLTATTLAESGTGDDGWVQLIGRNQPAIYMHAEGPIEVTVVDYRYTPNGIMYELENLKSPGFQLHKEGGEVELMKRAPAKWMVLASHLQPIHGRTEMVRYNLVTGEEEAG